MQQPHEELVAFLQESPCPTEAQIRQWIEDAVNKTNVPDKCLRWLLKGRGWKSMVLSSLSYENFKHLYEAPLADTPEEIQEKQRHAGVQLHDRGGITCMQLHWYLVGYAYMFFYEAEDSVVHAYNVDVSQAWSGIGGWHAD